MTAPRALVAFFLATTAASAGTPDYDELARRTRSLLARLVAADTSNPPGNEARAVALGVERLRSGGIPVEVTTFAPGRDNLVARLRGSGKARPLLLLAHVDVVGAAGQAWSSDPHVLTERGGFLVARGVADDLGMAATALEVFIALKETGAALDRDVILAWTGDEESGGAGIRWLLANRPDSVAAEIAFNEGGGPRLDDDGKVVRVALQTAEKTYQDFTVTARGDTGHSSVPIGTNAIYRLARALDRLASSRFPARLLPVTRAYLQARAAQDPPELATAERTLGASAGSLPPDALAQVEARPELSAILRTTCVATMVSGGTRVNALPAEASAQINCRILPGDTAPGIREQLKAIFDDPSLEIEPSSEFGAGEPSALDGPGPRAVEAVAATIWPGAPVVALLSPGATDSRFLRANGIVSYGLGPIPMSDSDARRAHGVDERIPLGGLRVGVEFLHRLVLAVAAAPGP